MTGETREAAPDAELKVDANQGWTPPQTIRFCRAVADRGVDLDGNLLLAADVIPTERTPTVDIDGPGHGVVPDR